MKITKIPGLGRFGVYIDDLNFATISDEEWLAVGKLHLETLVTIIRNVKLSPAEYELWMRKWGTSRHLSDYTMIVKYGDDFSALDSEDQKLADAGKNIMALDISPDSQMTRVSGKKDAMGNPLGMFAEGELLWHSNESGNLVFAPGVALMGHEGVVGSATGFVTTPDWYDDQSSSFQSELDQMIVQHRFFPGKINPGLRADQDLVMYKNMCPTPAELPLVCMSPGDIKGLHYSVNTIDTIKGMSSAESQKLFDYINKTLFVDKYVYDHWYQQDNDICLFDNSVTLHRRLGGISDRLCYRVQYDYGNLITGADQRYLIEPFASNYKSELAQINQVLGIRAGQ